jgi:hypothetical protein
MLAGNRPSRASRATALLALGALSVHELRYLLAYGGDAQQAMASQGHGYLGELTPAVAVLALSALFGRLVASALGRRTSSPRRRPLRQSTAAFAAALGAIFAVQELVEGAVSTGHPGGLAAIFANGGWIAVPLALAVGLMAASVDRVLGGAERALLRRSGRAWRRRLPRPSALRGARPGLAVVTATPAPLAFGLARRPPPAPAASGF